VTSADDPGDPRWWGIRGKVDRFDVRGTPRVGPETIGKPHVPPAIDEAVPHFRARRKATVRQWNVYWESKVPHPDAAWWSVTSGWNPTAQETFDAAWPRELDEDVDRLIDDYGSTWHTAFQVQAPTHYPDFVRQLSDLSGSGRLSLDNMYRGNVDVTVHLALREGPYRTTLQRRRWTFPTIVLCDVCGAEHYADTVRYYLLRRFGLPGVCTVCGHLAAFGDQVVTDSLEVSLAAIKQFVDVVGYIPGVSFRHKFTTVGMTRERRGLMLACAAMIGDPRAITKLHGGTWLKVLQAAGGTATRARSSSLSAHKGSTSSFDYVDVPTPRCAAMHHRGQNAHAERQHRSPSRRYRTAWARSSTSPAFVHTSSRQPPVSQRALFNAPDPGRENATWTQIRCWHCFESSAIKRPPLSNCSDGSGGTSLGTTQPSGRQRPCNWSSASSL
jgi:hypothetical protein